MNEMSPAQQQSGLPAALAAYLIWGFLPLYLLLVREVPAFEFVGCRIIWTLPLCLLIVLARGQIGQLRAAIAVRKALGILTCSAMLIAVNWLVYIWAIMEGEVYAASLGYYINPLVNVLLGTALLGERLARAQWVAVALAAEGAVARAVAAAAAAGSPAARRCRRRTSWRWNCWWAQRPRSGPSRHRRSGAGSRC